VGRYYGKDGTEVSGLREARKTNKFPSVTTVLNGCAPHEYKFMDSQRLKEAFDLADGNWAVAVEMLGQNLAFEQGSLVHEAAELFLETGVKSDPLEKPISSKQFFNVLSRIKEPLIEEFYFSEKMDTGGRVDVTWEKDGKHYLADYKTCMKVKKKASKSWLGQLGAYALLLEESGKKIDEAQIVQFSKADDGCHVIKLSKEELDLGKEIFIKARELYRLWINI